MDDPEAYVHWPTLKSKLWPIAVVPLPGWSWLPDCFGLRNWYHGCYWQFNWGRWLFMGGACHIKETP